MSQPHAAVNLLRHARREAVVVGIVWFLALVWTVGYCYLFGYQHPDDATVTQAGIAQARTSDNLRLILGFPDWVIIGIIAPWLACTAITILFCLFIMADDDLGTEADEGGRVHGH